MAENPIKKKGLGRGLSHLFGEAEAAYRVSTPEAPAPAQAPAGGGSTLPVTYLRPGKFQPRRHFDETLLDELAASIRQHGLLQPILVRPIAGEADAYEIIAGERRWRAAQRAKLHDVPVIVQSLTDTQALEIALVENLQRQDLSALEEAEGYKRLTDEFGHSHSELGELVGKSRSHVANMLRLLALPDGVKAMMQSGELSAGHARALLTAPDPEVLAKQVTGRNLSVRETERLANETKDARPAAKAAAAPASAKPKHADLLALERDMTERLGLRVTIDAHGSSGTLSIAYKNMDQLDDVLAKLSKK
ncbi:MAG TPA: ParB/RepB/Spo0J family partition protein [Alphaproteobacteria bacterium]|jgi:ParB family chromosome partitioning protein|nr:ParB/RepB/Spo0J family partition protein [Alphaproteobacteria bacterium]